METRRYAPMALLSDRPWGAAARMMADGRRPQVEQLLLQAGYRDLWGDPSAMADDELVENYAASFVMRANERDKTGDRMGAIMRAWRNEADLALECTRFCQRGRHVVQIDAALTTEFRHTALDGIRLDDVILPWESFYIAFDGPDAPHDDRMPLEGCFISGLTDDEGRPGNLSILPLYREGAWRDGMPILRLSVETDGRGLEEAFRTVAADVPTDQTVRDIVHPLANDETIVYADRLAQATRDMFDGEACQAILTRMLNLVGNALLYLATRPDGDAVEWQRDAPADLLALANAGNARSRKAGQALVRDGYTRVRYVGLPSSDHQSLGGTVRAHWRRGHWRRQHHGPGNSLVKIVRIRPTLVAGDAPSANASGRIHEVAA